MSQENVEIVRRMYEAWMPGGEALLSLADPEIEFSQPPGQPGAGTYREREGVRQGLAQWFEPWDDYRVEVDRLTDLGDHVLAETRQYARGKGSGVEVEHRVFQLWTLRDGRIQRARMYLDEAEALEAAGLAE
jgi:ketosteroid isomerase-like protein